MRKQHVRQYTTDSTVPEGCEEVWREWKLAWRRLASRHTGAHRRLEMKCRGFKLRLAAGVFSIVWVEEIPGEVLGPGLHVVPDCDPGVHVKVGGSFCSNCRWRPFVFVEDVRDAVHRIVAESVMIP